MPRTKQTARKSNKAQLVSQSMDSDQENLVHTSKDGKFPKCVIITIFALTHIKR